MNDSYAIPLVVAGLVAATLTTLAAIYIIALHAQHIDGDAIWNCNVSEAGIVADNWRMNCVLEES